MAPLAVDPAALDGAGSTVISVGEGLGEVVSTLTTALAGCDGMAGDDPAGSAFGGSYNTSASELLEAMAATRNGLCRLGDGVRMSAHNYSMAEAMSNVAGQDQPLPGPHPSGPILAQSVPSAVGSGVGAPAGWGWVAKYIGMIWPNADPAKLRAAAAAWISAGTNFEVDEALGATGPMASIGAQQIPEGAAIAAAFADTTRSATGILQQCNTIAAQLTALAAKIDKVHAAILDLLSRICDPVTGIKEVWEFLTDQDEDEIKKIANDIRIIVNQFTSEVDALRQQVATTLSEATTILTTMGRYAEKEWDQFLHHTDVGRALNQVGQYGKGLAESVGGLIKDGWTYGPIREFVDPQGSQQSWRELLHGMAPLVGLGDDHAPGVAQAWKEVGKNAVHWDEWKTNPAEAAGKSTFDLATLLIPGGGEAAAASKGARAAADAAEAASKASRAEAAATRALNDAAIPHVPAPAPHPETPPAPRPSGPPPDRPLPPTDKPAALGPTQPASAPTDVPSHHGPTESKPSAAANPESSAQARSTTPAEQRPITPGEPAPPAHPGSVADGAAAPPAAAGSAPHTQTPELSPPNSHPSSPQDAGAIVSHGSTNAGGEAHGGGSGGDGHGSAGENGHGGSGGHGGDGSRGSGGEDHGGSDGHGHGTGGESHGGGDGYGGKSDPVPNNATHTGLHDPPLNQGVPSNSLPDLTEINNEYRLPNGEIDPDRLGEWAQRVSDEYPAITKDGVEGVYDYTTENYDGMNPYLRDVDPLSPQQQEILDAQSINQMTESQREAWEARITHTDEGLSALPPYRADPTDAFSTTWRGLRAMDSLIDQFVEGGIFSDPAYLSTSTDSGVAEEFARGAGANQTPTLLRVDGYDGVDVMQLSRYMQESEILFPRGTNFEVLSKILGDDGLLRIIMKQMIR
jgi:ADP-ribosyltransferase exoenzyme